MTVLPSKKPFWAKFTSFIDRAILECIVIKTTSFKSEVRILTMNAYLDTETFKYK